MSQKKENIEDSKNYDMRESAAAHKKEKLESTIPNISKAVI